MKNNANFKYLAFVTVSIFCRFGKICLIWLKNTLNDFNEFYYKEIHFEYVLNIYFYRKMTIIGSDVPYQMAS